MPSTRHGLRTSISYVDTDRPQRPWRPKDSTRVDGLRLRGADGHAPSRQSSLLVRAIQTRGQRHGPGGRCKSFRHSAGRSGEWYSGQRLRRDLRPGILAGPYRRISSPTNHEMPPVKSAHTHSSTTHSTIIRSSCIRATYRAHPACCAEARTWPAAGGCRGRTARNVGFSAQESASRSKRKPRS